MNSRRYFLIQGSLATTAMLVLKPLKSFAGTVSNFTGIGSNHNKLVFLHTPNLNPLQEKHVINYINDLKNKNANTILLKAVPDKQSEMASLHYDASVHECNELALINGGYKIIDNDNLRTGIINVSPGESNVIERTKKLAAYLKEQKNCSIVVCLSRLGYKNNNAPDDISLANNSTDIDVIIGGHPENFHKNPVIALNSRNAEVIIHAASPGTVACGKIEIDFDGNGRKKQISFANYS
ncbi:MAG: hypothetical protein ACM3H8_07215 [Sphingobacteriales bacterium]